MNTHILIVDDCSADQYLCLNELNQLHSEFEISQAFDGAEALDTVQNSLNTVDIILLDINMPGMCGIEFLQNFQELKDKQSTQVVVLTSSMHFNDYQRCRNFDSVVGFLPKPISKDNLSEFFPVVSTS